MLLCCCKISNRKDRANTPSLFSDGTRARASLNVAAETIFFCIKHEWLSNRIQKPQWRSLRTYLKLPCLINWRMFTPRTLPHWKTIKGGLPCNVCGKRLGRGVGKGIGHPKYMSVWMASTWLWTTNAIQGKKSDSHSKPWRNGVAASDSGIHGTSGRNKGTRYIGIRWVSTVHYYNMWQGEHGWTSHRISKHVAVNTQGLYMNLAHHSMPNNRRVCMHLASYHSVTLLHLWIQLWDSSSIRYLRRTIAAAT